MRRVAALASLALGACLTQRDLGPLPREEKLEVVREKDGAGHVVREQVVLVTKGEKPVPHGPDKGSYSDGTPRFERAFDRGTPSGTWKSWHANGQLASETTFAGPDVEAPMRFWHENGVVSAEGSARDGSRCGPWVFRRADGSVCEEGTYVDSLRDGAWTVHEPSGELRHLTYARGVVVADQ